MELRLLPSDPAYPDVDRVARDIAILTNPQLFWDLRQMPEDERCAALAKLYAEFEELTH